MFDFWREATAASVPGFLCRSGRRRPENVSILSSLVEWRRLPRFPAKIRTLRSHDADGNENVKKTIGLISKTTTLHVHHAFLYISLPVFARLRREHA